MRICVCACMLFRFRPFCPFVLPVMLFIFCPTSACGKISGCAAKETCTSASNQQCSKCSAGMRLVNGVKDTCVKCSVGSYCDGTATQRSNCVFCCGVCVNISFCMRACRNGLDFGVPGNVYDVLSQNTSVRSNRWMRDRGNLYEEY